MIEKLWGTIAGVLASFAWTTNGFAIAVLQGGGGAGGGGGVGGGGGGGGGGGISTPEIDGSGAVMVVALLVSLGIMIYRKAQK